MIRTVLAALLSVMTLAITAPPAAASCVLCTCSVDASPLAFGSTLDPITTPSVNANGAVTVTCGPIGLLVGYDVRLSRGASGSYASRTLTSGADTLAYNLYTDAARTIVWGDGGGGSSVVSNSFLIGLGNTSRTHTVYGRIPALAGATPGVYADTIIATVVW
jgi:spore coat protein U-like protein